MIVATKFVLALLVALASNLAGASELARKMLESQVGEIQHQHDLYHMKSAAKSGKLPALLLVPEAWGKNELVARSARKLAQEGYVVLVVDIFGSDRNTKDASIAEEMIDEAEDASNGIDGFLQVLTEATRLLKEQSVVDGNRIGAIGFGFGGGLVYNLAKTGKSEFSAAISFFGGTAKIREAVVNAKSPKFLYVRPENDIYTTDDEFKTLKEELSIAKLPFDTLIVKGAYFGFINENIESYSPEEGKTFMHYDRKASEFAWNRTFRFLEKNLKEPSGDHLKLRTPASVGFYKK
jgi:dienelactone hydrolase